MSKIPKKVKNCKKFPKNSKILKNCQNFPKNVKNIKKMSKSPQKSKIVKKIPKNVKNPKFYFFEKLMQNLGSPWSFWLESIPNMHFCKKFGGQPPKKDPLQPKLKELQKIFFYKNV